MAEGRPHQRVREQLAIVFESVECSPRESVPVVERQPHRMRKRDEHKRYEEKERGQEVEIGQGCTVTPGHHSESRNLLRDCSTRASPRSGVSSPAMIDCMVGYRTSAPFGAANSRYGSSVPFARTLCQAAKISPASREGILGALLPKSSGEISPFAASSIANASCVM